MVEQRTVNPWVAGSSPATGAIYSVEIVMLLKSKIFLFFFLITSLQAKQILVLGDSLSAGYGLAYATPWPYELESCGWDVVNLSVSGSTIQEGHQRLRSYLEEKTAPDIILVALGSNDGLRSYPVDKIEETLLELVEFVQGKDIDLLLTGWGLPPNYGPYALKFGHIFQNVAKVTGTPFIECPLTPFAFEYHLFQDDGYHPNDEAQPLLAHLEVVHGHLNGQRPRVLHGVVEDGRDALADADATALLVGDVGYVLTEEPQNGVGGALAAGPGPHDVADVGQREALLPQLLVCVNGAHLAVLLRHDAVAFVLEHG